MANSPEILAAQAAYAARKWAVRYRYHFGSGITRTHTFGDAIQYVDHMIKLNKVQCVGYPGCEVDLRIEVTGPGGTFAAADIARVAAVWPSFLN